MSKDYYNILGIDKKASKDDVKKAFRKLAHKYHPDKKNGDEAQFKEVNEAYSVLSNEKKRAEYDTYGQAFSGGGGGFSGAEGFSGFGGQGFDFSGFSAQGDAQGFDMGDIFSEFFGGAQGGQHIKRGSDISVDIETSFSESIFGTERDIILSKTSTCKTCNGSGAKKGTEMKTCEKCNGNGKVREARKSFLGTIQTVRECSTCGASGKIPKEKCKECAGFGVIKGQNKISLKIPAGIRDGEMMRLSGQGEAVPRGINGDLYVKIYVKRDKVFSRDGNNIVMDLDIKLSEALLGTERNIKTLDGNINLKIPEGVSFGEILRVKGKGVPIEMAGRGDLLVKLNIKLPRKISKKVKGIIDELKDEGV